MRAADRQAFAHQARGASSVLGLNEIERAALVVGPPTTPVAAAIEKRLKGIDTQAVRLRGLLDHSQHGTPFAALRVARTMDAMAQITTDGKSNASAEADLEMTLLEQQLVAMEHPAGARKARWPWVLIVFGVLVVVALGAHGYTAYATLDRIDTVSKIDSTNPLVRFQDIATNGPKVGSTIE